MGNRHLAGTAWGWSLCCLLPYVALTGVFALAPPRPPLFWLAGPAVLLAIDLHVAMLWATALWLGSTFLAWYLARRFSPWSVVFVLVAVAVWMGCPVLVWAALF